MQGSPSPPNQFMDGKRSPSLVSELFGRKDSSGRSSAGSIFASAFPSKPSVAGKESSRSSSRKSSSSSSAAAAAAAAADGAWKSKPSRGRSSEKADPCFLSSSVYYGGQDFCDHPSSGSTNLSSTDHQYKKEGERDSDPIDSRGDWWQGSLYY